MTAKLYDLAGVSTADPLTSSWPSDRIRWENGDYNDLTGTGELISHLNDSLVFDNVKTGMSTDHDETALDGKGIAVGLTADVYVQLQSVAQGVVHRHLPDFTLKLVNTAGTRAAQLTWTRYADGTFELALLGLPVELTLPNDMLYAHDAASVMGAFDPIHPDSLEVHLEAGPIGPARLKFFANLRMTRRGEVMINPVCPLSIGRCVFMGLPCRAVHDIALYPDLLPDLARDREQFTGWAQKLGRSVLFDRVGDGVGVVTVRTLDLDTDDDNVKQVYEFLARNIDANHPALEVPLEDVAVVFDGEGGIPTPAYPIYGQTGLRRAVNDDTAAAEPFDHRLAPIILGLGPLYFHIHRLLIGWTQDPVINFDMAITTEPTNPDVGAVTVNFTQDWALLLGYAFATPKRIFKVGNAEMSLLAARGGVNFANLAHPDDEPRYKAWKWIDALADIGLVSHSDADDNKKIAFVTRSGGTLDVVLRDVGWKDGKPSITVWVPDGISLDVLGTTKFHIDAIGLATTTHGASYLTLSASYQIGDTRPPGSGIWLRGLRILMQRDNDVDAPDVAIDGIALKIHTRAVDVEGGGWMRDDIVGTDRIREFGFGISITKYTAASALYFSGLFVKGSIESSGVTTDYLLAGITLGPIPFGSFKLLRGSILVARNYVPKLPAPSGVEQNLRLYQWYHSQPGGLELPLSRVMGAWEPQPDSWVIGAGLRFGLGNSGKIKLDAFGMWVDGPEGWSLLIGLELRYDTAPEPIGWLVVDYDDVSGRWGAAGGVKIGVQDLIKNTQLPAVVQVTGSVFVANEPRTVAIGHIEDVDSWLQFKVSYQRFSLLLRVGFCFYDYAGDPPVTAMGFVVTGKGKISIPLTELTFLLEVAVLLGSFSSDGPAAGVLASVEAALALKFFHIRFGIRSKIQVQSIHPDPESGTATIDFSLETPWWLPDVHVSHTWTFGGDPAIASSRVLSLPLGGAQALGLAAGTAVDLATPLPAGADDAGRPYSLDEFEQLVPAAPGADVFDALTPVPVDSVVALNFAATMTDTLGTGETTPMAASRQANGELWCDYEVIEIGIRRRPRYGLDAGAWSTLLAPADTSTAAVDPVGQTVDELVATFTSEVSFKWDRDEIRAGQLDARRLLVNAATPFALTTANPIADETLLDDTGATCCDKPRSVPWRQLDFETVPVGTRLPAVTPFPGNAAHVCWHSTLPPVVTEIDATRWARIPLTGRGGTTLATVRFDRPAARAWVRVLWSMPVPATVRFELQRGLSVIARRDVALGALQAQTVELRDGQGADRLVIRLLEPLGATPLGALYIDALAYIGRDELINWLMGRVHCATGGTLPGGTLAWLPNHDYEVAVTCSTTVGHDRVGSASVPVTQTALFRTKGWPGLNAPATPGGDLAPFVEARYPRRSDQPLYRDEPILLVMNERFTPLAPPVGAPLSAPPERRQLLEWSMLVDAVGIGDRGSVATYSSPDWLSIHRQPHGPPGPRGGREDAALSRVRRATSLDPRMLRLDGVRRSPANCQPHDATLHSSRIFSCDPPAGGWEHGSYHARIVQRGGPYVMRTAFEPADPNALTEMADGGPAAAWTVQDGVLVAPAGAERAWAVFGDTAWIHTHLTAQLELAGGTAGLAVAVGGVGANADALLAVVDSAAGSLRIERRLGGAHQILAEEALAVADQVKLELIGYDDEVVARVGQIEARASRGAQRDGRVALVATAGVRVSQLVVEPIEAYALDVTTSQWNTFDAHIAAHRDAVPLALDVSSTVFSAWLAGAWDDIASVMAPNADPLRRATVFRAAIERLGIPAVEDPLNPTITRLLIGGVSGTLLLEGPEPLPLSTDVRVTLQRRRRKPPFPPPHWPPLQPPRAMRRGVHESVIAVEDLELDPFPSDITQWNDVETLVLTDGNERRAIVLPVNAATRSPLAIGGPIVRIRFDLDRERYRSADPDPQARIVASATRMTEW